MVKSFNSTVNDKKISIHSKIWWSEDMKNKNKVFNAMRRKRKKKLTKNKEYSELKIAYNAYRREIKIMKQRNLERKNVIKEHYTRIYHKKKLGNMSSSYSRQMQKKCQHLLTMKTKRRQIKRRQICWWSITQKYQTTCQKQKAIINHFAHLNNNTTNNNSAYNKPYTLEQINESIKKLKPQG